MAAEGNAAEHRASALVTDALTQAYAHCGALLREHDKDRFLADLFLPQGVRPHAHALEAFSFEVARVREAAREPLAGELRQQWWRDALSGEGRGEATANPVAAALLDTIERFRLERGALEALIDARGFDLYDDPMEDFAALESYCRDTSSALFRLIAEMLGRASKAEAPSAQRDIAAAASPAGIAYAYAGLIRAFPLHAAQGRIYLPGDALRRHEALLEDVFAGRSSPALLAAIADWRAEARRHLAAAKAAIAALPAAMRPAFLPIALVEPYLRVTEKRGYEPFRTPIELPQWRRQWILWRGL
jgi:phytoene synthase